MGIVVQNSNPSHNSLHFSVNWKQHSSNSGSRIWHSTMSHYCSQDLDVFESGSLGTHPVVHMGILYHFTSGSCKYY